MGAHFNLISIYIYITRKYSSYDITEFQISRSKVKVTRGHNSQNLIIPSTSGSTSGSEARMGSKFAKNVIFLFSSVLKISAF